MSNQKAVLSIHTRISALRVFQVANLQRRHTTIIDKHMPGYFLEICA